MDLNRFAVDLLWLRVGKNGGSETFIRNILDGMCETDRDFNGVLLVSRDNADSFEHYKTDARFSIYECPVDSENIGKRLLWQNLHLADTVKKLGIKKCFEPVYSVPFIKTGGIEFYTVIHDIQAKHFPDYFSWMRRVYMDMSWKNAIHKSKWIVSISNYAMADIEKEYPASSAKLTMIYNPISVKKIDDHRAKEIISEYGVLPNEFFLCVSSLLPHKNLEVLIHMMARRADDMKLVIVGVGGALENKFNELIEQYGLKGKVKLIAYIEDEKRDALYSTCRAFLFPSVFEGFGMPPVEAMLMDKPVITTKCTSIPEVTRNEAFYVDDPESIDEWIETTDLVINDLGKSQVFEKTISSRSNPYSRKKVADKYLDLLLLK